MRFLLIPALAALAACLSPPYRVEFLEALEPPLHPHEIVQLANAGISETIIEELAARRGVRPLDADDLVAIKKSGIKDDLLKELIQNERHDPPVLRSSDLGYFYPSSAPYYYDFQHFAPYGGYSSNSYSSWGFGY